MVHISIRELILPGAFLFHKHIFLIFKNRILQHLFQSNFFFKVLLAVKIFLAGSKKNSVWSILGAQNESGGMLKMHTRHLFLLCSPTKQILYSAVLLLSLPSLLCYIWEFGEMPLFLEIFGFSFLMDNNYSEIN